MSADSEAAWVGGPPPHCEGDACGTEPKAEPVRTCIGCRRRAGHSELVRFVADEGELVPGDRRPGRGAWLCRDRLVECFDAATAGRRWARALRSDVDPGKLAQLRDHLAGLPD